MARPKKPDSEKATKLSISLAPDLLERVMKYCNQEERTISWVIKKALIEWLEDKGV